jgi:LPS export ABC transporter permease LptF
MRILRNYVLRELIWPCLFAFIVFTFIMVMGNLIRLADMVINKNVAILDVGRLFVLLIPSLLCYTIPMAVLAGVLIAFGRLASDNEVAGMKACGIGIHRFLPPVLLISLLMSLGLLILNDDVVPKSRFASRNIVKQIGVKSPQAFLEAGTFIKSFRDHIIFIHAIEGNTLKNITIYQTREDGPPRTIIAERGEIIPSVNGNSVQLKLVNVIIPEIITEQDAENPEKLKFVNLQSETYFVTLNLPEDRKETQGDKKPSHMTTTEIRSEIRQLESAADNTKPIRAYLEIEIHKRIGLSFAMVVFVLIGLPLSIRLKRAQKSVGFGITALVIFLYYILFLTGEFLSLKWMLPPWVSGWLSNVVMGGIGAGLTAKVIRK